MTEPKKLRGFALLSPEARIANAKKAGRIAQDRGNAHRWTKDEAKAAGSKGGRASSDARRLAPPHIAGAGEPL